MTTAAIQTSTRYQPLAQIGRGGMAEVILAEMQIGIGITSLAVLKRLRPELADDPDFVSMFLREARLCARMNHPNIVRTYEIVEDAGAASIAMEYLDGQPLARVLNRLMTAETLSLAARLRMLADVLGALHYAHELRDHHGVAQGIVHRDVNPQNVFVTYDGMVKLLDFGIAKSANDAFQTRPGDLRGKLAYLAPEQALGEVVDRRTDIFSVGVMLWEMVSGRRMWQSMTEASIMRQLSAGRIPPLPREAAVPPRLAEACACALSRKPERRFATAAEFASVLHRLLPAREDAKGRHLGRLVALAFAPERAARRTLIEEHLRRLRGTERDGRIETVGDAPNRSPVGLPELRPDRATPGGMWAVHTEPEPEAVAETIELGPADILEVVEDLPAGALAGPEGVGSSPIAPRSSQIGSGHGSAPRLRRVSWMAAGFAVAVAVAGAAFAGRAAGSHTARGAAAPSSASVAGVGALPRAGSTVVPIGEVVERAPAASRGATGGDGAACVAAPVAFSECRPSPGFAVKRRRAHERVGSVASAERKAERPSGPDHFESERAPIAGRNDSDDETLEPTIDLSGIGAAGTEGPAGTVRTPSRWVDPWDRPPTTPRAGTAATAPPAARRSVARAIDVADPFAP